MKYSELTRKLTKLGCEFRRQAKGGHEIWWHPGRKRYTTIPHHGAKDIPKGTLAAILTDLGFTYEDLDKV
ncbi:MAG: type II toxin-antitoxin system HicA family toxin [Dehalococcoidia bacterium]|nr:type II toxin-antitoxin system HicA family toxin [Dehalococcoidia bacterium]